MWVAVWSTCAVILLISHSLHRSCCTEFPCLCFVLSALNSFCTWSPQLFVLRLIFHSIFFLSSTVRLCAFVTEPASFKKWRRWLGKRGREHGREVPLSSCWRRQVRACSGVRGRWRVDLEGTFELVCSEKFTNAFVTEARRGALIRDQRAPSH